jgi:hypothetical protein
MPRRRWEDTIKTDARKTECEAVDWIYLAQDRASDGLLCNGNVPSGFIKTGNILTS